MSKAEGPAAMITKNCSTAFVMTLLAAARTPKATGNVAKWHETVWWYRLAGISILARERKFFDHSRNGLVLGSVSMTPGIDGEHMPVRPRTEARLSQSENRDATTTSAMGATEPISYAATIPISAGAKSGFCVRSKRRFRPLVLAVLPLAACTVGPDFVKPDAAVNPSWREQGGGIRAEESAANRDWWRSLGSPTLTTLVELAYRINPNLQVAGVRVLQAQAQLNIAIGAQFPQQQALSGSIAYQSKVPGLLASESDIVTRQIGVGATWELDFWGKYRSQAALNYNPNVSGYGC